MASFLANENTPRDAVVAARAAGHDVDWIVETYPGVDDDVVLARAQRESRVLITFDKDFGELVFRLGKNASNGVLLLRPRLSSPGFFAAFVTTVMSQPITWAGHFTVAREGVVRTVPLP